MALSSWLTGLFGNSKDDAAGGASKAGALVQEAPELAAQGEPGKRVLEEWAREIAQILAPVDNPPPKQGTSRPGLARDILSYVLTGEPQGVLNEVGLNTVVGTQLQTLGKAGKSHHITPI